MSTNEIVEFVEEKGGIYFRSILLPRVGIRVPQHVHPYDHATLVCAGRALLFVDGIACDIVEAGHAVEIKAGRKHEFESLEPNTRLTCITDAKLAEHDKAIPLTRLALGG